MGDYNDSSDLDLENDDEDQEDSSSPSVADPVPAPSAPAPLNPMVAAHLQAKMMADKNKGDLEAAQNLSAKQRMIAGLSRAGATLASSAYGATGPIDEAGFNGMDKNANIPVENVLNQQKAQTQNITNEESLLSLKEKQDSMDPTSEKSKQIQDTIKKLYPGKYTDEELSRVTAATAQESIFKPLELHEKIMELAEAAKLRNEAKTSADKKITDEKHNTYLTHIEDKESGWRSDPATMRADTNLAAVKTANDILSKYRGNEDAMPMADIHALAAEKIRVMTGGVGTESDIQAQIPHNLYTKYAGAKSFFTGSQEPAKSGDWVRNLDSYFKDIEKSSLEAVQNRQKTVASDPRITPEERERVQKIGVPIPVYKDKIDQPLKPPVIQNGHTYNWNPTTKTYE